MTTVPTALKIPRNMLETMSVRYQPPPVVNTPDGTTETPFISRTDPDHKKLQEVWTARVRVFDLSSATDTTDYEKVWQQICDGHAKIAAERTEFDDKKGRFVVFMRWAEFSYTVPGNTGGIAPGAAAEIG